MQIDKGPEKIGDLLAYKRTKKPGEATNKQPGQVLPPAYSWQDLALRVIKELSIPEFKRSAVFKVCKIKPRTYIENCLNDTKELCQTGEKWKYFFKLISGGKKFE